MTEKTNDCTTEKTNDCTEDKILMKLNEMSSEIASLKSRISSLRTDIQMQSSQNPNLIAWFRTLRK